jgi:hypothetical protein
MEHNEVLARQIALDKAVALDESPDKIVGRAEEFRKFLMGEEGNGSEG